MNIPVRYKPSKGPYVYPAILNINEITSPLLPEKSITIRKTMKEKPIKTLFFNNPRSLLSFLEISRKSCVNDVVRAVSAESTLEKEAAINSNK